SLAEQIARDGNVIYSRNGVPRSHPAIRDELAARAFVCRILERLGLNVETIKPPGRPPTPSGWSPDVRGFRARHEAHTNPPCQSRAILERTAGVRLRLRREGPLQELGRIPRRVGALSRSHDGAT